MCLSIFYCPSRRFPSCRFTLTPGLTLRRRRAVVDQSKERVAILATGGLSHFPGSPRIGEIDESFDHKLLDVMRQGKGKSLVDYSVQDLLQAGDTEFLNWMVVVGAIGDAKASYTAYMPDFVATGWGFVSWRLV